MIIARCIDEIDDPRSTINRIFSLEALVLVIFSSVISGYDSVEEMVDFTELKFDWLNKWVDLPRVPSAETLRFLLCTISSQQLAQCFKKFVELNSLNQTGDFIPIDGKTMRGTDQQGFDAVHVISAWSTHHGLTLAALESQGKKNEIQTIPEVIRMVGAKNAIFSTDAMGCQTKIAASIIDSGNDYMLQIKGNQANLLKEIQAYHHKLERDGYDHESYQVLEEVDKGHGRIEQRCYTHFKLTDWVDGLDNWKSLKSAVKVNRKRTIGGVEVEEISWYISSLPVDVQLAAKSIRSHWGIENSLHWRLDVIFREDQYSVYSGNGALNMAIIKRFCMNLLKQAKPGTKRSRTFKSRIMCCAIDDSYREQALFG